MARQVWGEPDGVAEGSDFALEAILTLDGAVSPSLLTSSGAYTVTVEDTAPVPQTILVDEPSDAFTASSGLARWEITAAQSASWPAGTFAGDIKLLDSGGKITYWPVSLRIRSVID